MSDKNTLQEFCQQHGLPLPVYSTQRSGDAFDDHAPRWDCTVAVAGLLQESVTAVPGKKVHAQQMAARQALQTLVHKNHVAGASRHDHSVSTGVPDSLLSGTLSQQSPRVASFVSAIAMPRPDPICARILVMVDADQIAFVDAHVCANLPSVTFRMYHAHGANLPHIRACEQLANVTVLGAPQPVSDMADTMITIDAARTPPRQPVIIVSRDKALYNVALLLDNVEYVSTLQDLAIKLRRFC